MAAGSKLDMQQVTNGIKRALERQKSQLKRDISKAHNI